MTPNEKAQAYAKGIIPNPNANDAPFYTTGDVYDMLVEAHEEGAKGSAGVLISVEDDLPPSGKLVPVKTNYKRWVIAAVDREGEWDDYPLTFVDEEIIAWLDETK